VWIKTDDFCFVSEPVQLCRHTQTIRFVNRQVSRILLRRELEMGTWLTLVQEVNQTCSTMSPAMSNSCTSACSPSKRVCRTDVKTSVLYNEGINKPIGFVLRIKMVRGWPFSRQYENFHTYGERLAIQ
jgi:hypothetical protein